MGKYINAPEGFVEKVRYIDLGDTVKAAVYTSERCRAFADMGGVRYGEMFNDKEPFDFKTHHFTFDKDELRKNASFGVSFTPWRAGRGIFADANDITSVTVRYDEADLIPYTEEAERMDRCLCFKHSEEREICEGARYAIEHYETKDGAPVVVYTFRYDPTVVEMCTGTPDGTYDYRDQKQTVMGEAEYALSQGKRVIGAFNADFFDMFGDCAPSGLCVKDGVIIANADSKRYFFGTKKNGDPIIDSLVGKTGLVNEIENAVCGINLLLDNGNIVDVGIGEPFGYIAHPRTVAGICSDGSVIVMVIDGRRPWHSNGATLIDAAKLLLSHGAVRGLNLDGGGSSTFIVENADGKLEMLNHPADLHRPTEDLIRDVFNSILLIKK